MRITKFGHACVRLQPPTERVVVIDPGAFTEPEAIDGATAVLITHEHPDHYAPDRLRRTDAPVFTIGAVADKIREEAPDVAERITVVAPGDRSTPVSRHGRRREARGDPSGCRTSTTAASCSTSVTSPSSTPATPSPCRGGGRPAAPPGERPVAQGQRVHRLRPRRRRAAIVGHPRRDLQRGRSPGDLPRTCRRFLGERGQEYVRLPEGADLSSRTRWACVGVDLLGVW